MSAFFLRQLFKEVNYSREDTVHENMVYLFITQYPGIPSSTGPVLVDRIRAREAGHGKKDRAGMNQRIPNRYIRYLTT